MAASRSAGWDDVRRIALALPETSERTTHGHAGWWVRNKLFVWERPLRPSDLHALGKSAPKGPILGVRVEHLLVKEALLKNEPRSCFTIPHFDGYPAVLIQLRTVTKRALRNALVDGWSACAPPTLADELFGH